MWPQIALAANLVDTNLPRAPQGKVDFAQDFFGREAITVLDRAKQKFEFPVNWGIDLQSEHERHLTERHAKKPVIVMNYPEGHQGVPHVAER